MKVKILGAVVAIAVSGFVSQASATIVDVVYTGTVTYGYDSLGLFGGGWLQGESYKAQYIFDTTQGAAYSDPMQSFTYGGTAYGDMSPLVSGSLTIGGRSIGIDGQTYSVIEAYSDGYFGFQGHAAQGGDFFLTNSIEGGLGGWPAGIATPFTYHVNWWDGSSGEFDVASQSGVYTPYIVADLQQLTVSDVSSAVPEASTWTMMLVGFAGLGFTAFRRAKVSKAALAAA